MIKRFLHTVFICFVSMFFGCEAFLFDDLSDVEHCVVSSEYFKHIVVANSFDIVLKQQDYYSVTVQAPVELQEGVRVSIVNDTLTISDNNRYQWSPSYKMPVVIFGFPNLPSMHIKAPANVQVDSVLKQHSFRLLTTSHTGNINLNVDVMTLSVGTGYTYDSGVFTISGRTGNASFWMRNSSTLNAIDLNSESLRVINNSRGDSYVRTNGKLRVTINSYGNVYYLGNPSEIVVEEQSSTGELIPLSN